MSIFGLVPVTGLYAGILAVGYTFLGINVSVQRQNAKVSLGDGTLDIAKEIAANRDPAVVQKRVIPLQKAIRAHGNFGEWVPLMVTLLGFLEANNAASRTVIQAGGAAILISRILLTLGIYGPTIPGPARKAGATGTYFTVLFLAGANIYYGINHL
eukprot:TRINITY_DN692_c0_g1_i1.p1 TRINITY_DN692_c0_g1~~TRINITY_DN692_c0_g1_i1.p1  ORF type:complete len:156 (-),score=6.97 TRINITY_DN692_c0_g1_i1:64-531(-)